MKTMQEAAGVGYFQRGISNGVFPTGYFQQVFPTGYFQRGISGTISAFWGISLSSTEIPGVFNPGYSQRGI
jgi:hypothetical protein